jgi:hypothetical protein
MPDPGMFLVSQGREPRWMLLGLMAFACGVSYVIQSKRSDIKVRDAVHIR